jgi:CheY-like chemotaxis protein
MAVSTSSIRSRARAASAPLVRARRRIAGAGLYRAPRGDELAAASAPRGSASPATRAERIRVLVVDDEPSIRALCRVNLTLAGFEVAEAADGRAALEAIERGPPDLVLLDVMMPDVDGWTVARELADDERTRDIPVVFLTARADAADKRLGQELGGVGYLVKPFDPVLIGEYVEDVLTRIERGEREQLRRGIASDRER